MKHISIFAFALALLLMPATAAFAGEPLKEPLVVAGGQSGGTGLLTATAWMENVKREYPGSAIEILPGNSNMNILKLIAGEYDVILSTTNFMRKVHYGLPHIKEITEPAPELMAVVNTTEQFFCWTVRADFPYKTIDELFRAKAKFNICPGGRRGDAGTTATEEYLRTVYGVNYKDLESWGCKIVYTEFGEAVQMLRDGQIDLFSPITAAPAGALLELTSTTDVKFLPMEDEGMDKMLPLGYVKAMMSKSLYRGMTEDVPTLSLPYGAAAHSRVSEDTVYKITKVICENADNMKNAVAAMSTFNPAKSAKEMGFPLHPGAAKYFREMGWID